MESILDELTVLPKSENKTYENLRSKAGLAVRRYAVITVPDIQAYLQKRLDKHAESMSGRMDSPSPGWRDGDFRVSFSGNCIENRKWIPRSFGWFSAIWVEVPVEESFMNPPEHVLKSIVAARPDFDLITIATVSVQKTVMLDPLVLGRKRKKGRSEDDDKQYTDPRYLIDWWDKDIDPTELTMEPK